MNEYNEGSKQVEESKIFGVSIRGWLAMFTVVSGIAFIAALTFVKDNPDLTTTALTAVVGFVNLALGYYLGQKHANEV